MARMKRPRWQIVFAKVLSSCKSWKTMIRQVDVGFSTVIGTAVEGSELHTIPHISMPRCMDCDKVVLDLADGLS